MSGLIAKIVFSGFITACRFAGIPTRISPSLPKATMDGVVRPPSAFSITRVSPFSITATQEFVVPRSIPITFDAILVLLANGCGWRRAHQRAPRYVISCVLAPFLQSSSINNAHHAWPAERNRAAGLQLADGTAHGFG